METNIKRPPSVWITQILIVILALLFALPALIWVIVYGGGIGAVSFPRPFLLILLAINLGISFLYLLCFWALVRRKSYSRWLSIVLLVTGFGAIVLVAVVGFPIVIFLLTASSFLFLIYRLAFGSAANAFFAKTNTPE